MLALLLSVALCGAPDPLVHLGFDSPPAAARRVPGVVDTAVEPVGGPLTLNLDAPLPHPTGTLALWVRPGFGWADAQARTLVHIPSPGAAATDNWQLQWLGDGELLLRAGAMAGSELRVGGWRFEPGRWFHLAVAYDLRSLELWVNGRRAASRVAPTLQPPPGAVVHLGAWADGGRFADSAFDELRIYDAKLTADDLAALAVGPPERVQEALAPPPPAGRAVARPGPPAPAGTAPGQLVGLDFERWPAPWLSPLPSPEGPAQVSPAPGRVGQGLRFDRGGVSVELAAALAADRGSLALWVQPLWDGPPDDSHVFLHLPSRGGQVMDNVHLQTWSGSLSSRAGALSREGVAGAGINSDAVKGWRAGEWHHLALVWDAERLVLYVDGEAVAEQTDPAYPYPPGTPLTVGAWPNGDRSAQAVLDEVRLFERALTPDEVRALAAEGER